MAEDIVVVKGPLTFLLEFAEVDPMTHGVEARFEVGYSGRRQRLTWSAEHLWFEYEALRRFESELGGGREARLYDMSEYPILHFMRESSQEYLTINPGSPTQSKDGDSVAVRLIVDSGSMQALHSALNQFGKWW